MTLKLSNGLSLRHGALQKIRSFLWMLCTESVCLAQQLPSSLGMWVEFLVDGAFWKRVLVLAEPRTAKAFTAFRFGENCLQMLIPKCAFLQNIENDLVLVRHGKLCIFQRVQRSIVPLAGR